MIESQKSQNIMLMFKDVVVRKKLKLVFWTKCNWLRKRILCNRIDSGKNESSPVVFQPRSFNRIILVGIFKDGESD